MGIGILESVAVFCSVPTLQARCEAAFAKDDLTWLAVISMTRIIFCGIPDNDQRVWNYRNKKETQQAKKTEDSAIEDSATDNPDVTYALHSTARTIHTTPAAHVKVALLLEGATGHRLNMCARRMKGGDVNNVACTVARLVETIKSLLIARFCACVLADARQQQQGGAAPCRAFEWALLQAPAALAAAQPGSGLSTGL
eukprot:362018-Chlamydomonas_euryale.AAC.13